MKILLRTNVNSVDNQLEKKQIILQKYMFNVNIKLYKYIEVKEQELVTPERKGFIVVEWGGTEIK